MKLPNLSRIFHSAKLRTKRAAFVAGAVIVIGGGAGGFVIIHPSGGTADYYLSTGGFDVGSCGVGAPCKTPQYVCNLAVAAGGAKTVQANAGTYTIGLILHGCNPANTLTFKNQSGQFTDFAGVSTICNSSNITLTGDAIGVNGAPTGFSLGYTSISSGGPNTLNCTTNTGPVSNITITKVNSYCQNIAPWDVLTSGQSGEVGCNASVQLAGTVNNVVWDGNDQENWATCFTSCTASQGAALFIHNTMEPGPTNITIAHWTDRHYWDLDTNGSTLGDHSEAWMIRGAQNIHFYDNTLTDCFPPPSTGYPNGNSCNSSYIFFGQSGTANTTNFIYFTQNIVLTNVTGEKAIDIAYDVPAAQEMTMQFLYNDFGGTTFCGPSSTNDCGPSPGTTFTGTNVVFVGNVSGLGATGVCFPAGTYIKNDWYQTSGNSASCSVTDQHFNSTPITHFITNPLIGDFSPLALIQGAGENTWCATIPGGVDNAGKARPTSTPCDLGAIQH